MIVAVCIAALLLSVAGSALFSGSETGIYCTNRLRIRLASGRGDRRASRIQSLLDDEETALSVTLVGTNLANYLTTVFTAILIGTTAGLSESQIEAYTTLMATPLLFVFGEVLPKYLFQRDADRLLTRCSAALYWTRWTLEPVLWGIRRLNRAVTSILESKSDSVRPVDLRFRMADLLREELADQDHRHEPGDLVNRVLSLSDTPVGQVMVARDHVISIPADADRNALVQLARRCPFNRVPVYQRQPANIIGVVHVPSLLADPSWKTVRDRIQAPVRLWTDETVATALLKVQRSGLSMAIVTDRQERMLGIVTLKELLEQIVGDLAAW